MLLDELYSDLPEDCRKLNIKLFFLYTKAQLSREQERFIDAHCGRCDHCRANLAYVYEIVKGNERLSSDGQTLLLKYLHDPIYKDILEKLKNNIREEILAEVKALLADNLKGSSLGIDTVGSSVADDSITNSSNQPNKTTNETSQIPRVFNKIINGITNIQVTYSYFASALLVVVFVGLSIFTYLAINSKSNQLNNASGSSSTPIISSFSQQDKQVTTNLYQQLDTAIDQYLTSKNIDDLNKAQFIAKDIERNYDDKYGTDLVAYYQTVPSTALEKLAIYHKALLESFDQSTGDNYQQRLEDSLKLEDNFLSLGNLIEANKTKALTNKLYVQLRNYERTKSITQEGLSFSLNKKYIFLQLHFLLWKAKYLSQISDLTNAEESLLQVIELGNKLTLHKVVNSAGTSLVTLYYRNDNNEKALDLSRKLLVNFPNYKNTQAISILQIAGMASFNLHYYDIAESYLKEAITNSQALNSSAFTIRSYSFLALILSEQKKFNEANNFYMLAEDELKNISDTTSKQETLGVIVGYKAKTKLLEQDYDQALELYQQKLFIINTLHLDNNLEISQINEAMAIALTQLGQKEKAQEHIAIAKNYKNLAEASKETNNCLLSLAPSNCLARQD